MNEEVRDTYLYLLTREHHCYYHSHQLKYVIDYNMMGDKLKRTNTDDKCNMCRDWTVDTSLGGAVVRP